MTRPSDKISDEILDAVKASGLDLRSFTESTYRAPEYLLLYLLKMISSEMESIKYREEDLEHRKKALDKSREDLNCFLQILKDCHQGCQRTHITSRDKQLLCEWGIDLNAEEERELENRERLIDGEDEEDDDEEEAPRLVDVLMCEECGGVTSNILMDAEDRERLIGRVTGWKCRQCENTCVHSFIPVDKDHLFVYRCVGCGSTVAASHNTSKGIYATCVSCNLEGVGTLHLPVEGSRFSLAPK